MKYSEFEVAMRKMRFEVIENSPYIEVWENRSELLLVINKNMRYSMNVRSLNFESLSAIKQELLFNLAVELASTPLDEREDEKRYYVKFMEKVYLVHYPKSRNYGVVSTREGAQGKTQFTEQEIKNYDSRYWAFAEEVKEDEQRTDSF